MTKGCGDFGKWRHCSGCMNVAWGMCWGGSRSTKPCVFPCKATSSVRRVRLRSFCPRLVPPMCFATGGCVYVHISMRLLNLWLQIALEWLHDCCHLVLPCA